MSNAGSSAFAGKTALITGGASGIGRATAIAFARSGAGVVVADLDERGGQETVRQIESLGAPAIFVTADVTDGASVAAMVGRAVARFGRLDCAFNNAGIAPGEVRLADFDEETFDRVMVVNVKGVWHCLKHEIRQMLAQVGGAIVNAGSIASFSGMSPVRYGAGASSAYVTSKHAVAGLTRAAAIDYAHAKIRVNAVCPGVVRTPMYEESLRDLPGRKDAIASMHPMGRVAEADEVAKAVLFLCSDDASFMTGHMLAVDGGFGAA